MGKYQDAFILYCAESFGRPAYSLVSLPWGMAGLIFKTEESAINFILSERAAKYHILKPETLRFTHLETWARSKIYVAGPEENGNYLYYELRKEMTWEGDQPPTKEECPIGHFPEDLRPIPKGVVLVD